MCAVLYGEFRSVDEKVEINKKIKKGDFISYICMEYNFSRLRTQQRNAQDFIKNSLQLIRHQPEQNLKLSDVERM